MNNAHSDLATSPILNLCALFVNQFKEGPDTIVMPSFFWGQVRCVE